MRYPLEGPYVGSLAGLVDDDGDIIGETFAWVDDAICPVCGEYIDFCQGHGLDSEVMRYHDHGIHDYCAVDCEELGIYVAVDLCEPDCKYCAEAEKRSR